MRDEDEEYGEEDREEIVKKFMNKKAFRKFFEKLRNRG
jgi:hypothetical protein